MQIAFIILAHDQPDHLARLVKRISKPWNTIFIHIDKKSDINKFKSLVEEKENIIYVDKKRRVNVSWGGFSAVKSTLNMIDMARQHQRDFDRYCLLSGADYPIKNTEEIFKGLNNDTEFIFVGSKITDGSASKTHASYIKYYHFEDTPLLKKLRLSGRLWRKLYRKIDIYHGSQWFCLSKHAIEYALDFISRNPDYMRYMKYTLCSDEIFFTSIIKSSPYSDQMSFGFGREVSRSSFYSHREQGIHYIDWDHPSNNNCSPRVLTMLDKDSLRNTNALFARKFDQNESLHLLDYIDKLIDAN